MQDWTAWSPGSMDPALDGISAGLDTSGKDVYVGRGVHKAHLAPGKLMIEEASDAKRALYLEWSQEEQVLTEEVEYYAKESHCEYAWVPSDHGKIVPGAVTFRSYPYTYYIGRATIYNSTQVGRVNLERFQMFYAYGGKGYQVNTYEVLVCNIINIAELRETITGLNGAITSLGETNTDLNEKLRENTAKCSAQTAKTKAEMTRMYETIATLKKRLNACWAGKPY